MSKYPSLLNYCKMASETGRFCDAWETFWLQKSKNSAEKYVKSGAMMASSNSMNAINLGMGQLTNRMGWLTKKNGQTGFNPALFLKQTGIRPSNLGTAIGQSRPAMYKDFIPLKPTNNLQKKIVDLVTAADIAFELFGKDEKETAHWIVSPNMLLFGETPFEVCMRGDGKPLIAWLLERAGQAAISNKKDR